MKQFHSFLNDTNARIPFSILGIFLLISSSLTSVYLSEVDKVHTDYYISSIQESDFEQLLYCAEADIASMMNTVGTKTLQSIGKNPIIQPVDSNRLGQECNQHRFKKMFAALFNQLLLLNFKDNAYTNGRYAINIIVPSSQSVPIEDIDEIVITPVDMTVERPIHVPLIGPDAEETFPTYWNVDVPLRFDIYSLIEDKKIGEYANTISKVISSRYPLLYDLAEDYNQTLQAFGPYWGFITAITNIYSLARGYKHYQSGKPQNVVDNTHLTVLLNGGLLFEQGLCFGSIDPHSLLQVLSECNNALFKKNQTNPIDSLNSLDQDQITIPTSWFSTVPANIENNEEGNRSIDQNPQINLSEVVSMILYSYQTIEIVFEQSSSGSLFSIFLSNASSEDIKDCINEYVTDDTVLHDVRTHDYMYNQTSRAFIKDIINISYTSSFTTDVSRDSQPQITIGDHTGFPIDNGTSSWEITSRTVSYIKEKPPKGEIHEDSLVYEECYDILWSRTHYWSKKEIIANGNNTIVQWSFISTEDTKQERNVSFSINVVNISSDLYSNMGIHEVFYENLTLNDINMEDTIEVYKNTIFQGHLEEFLHRDTGVYYHSEIMGNHQSWVFDEAINGINDVLQIIATIEQNESINASTYSNPLTLLENAIGDLLAKYRQLIPVMKNESQYTINDLFSSTGMKAAYCCRAWFVDYTYSYLQMIGDQILQTIDTSIDDSLEGYDFQQQNEVLSLLNNQDEGSFFSESFTIPFGLSLSLKSFGTMALSQWNESLHLSVNQYPKYLSPFVQEEYEGKKEYFLAVRNTCLLGTTGLPILPITPTTPWIVTLNTWLLSFRGSYAEFILADGNDETIPNPLFGHDTQIIIRKQANILDENGAIIGRNTRISFAFDTMCFSVVPSWGLMVGDTQDGLIEEKGFDD